MIDRQSLLAQLLMGPPQPATRLSQLAAGAPVDPVDAMRASLPPMATPDTRAGQPNRLAELTMPSAEFEPAVRPFGSPHVPAVTTPSEEQRLVDLAMMLSSFVGSMKTPRRLFHVVGDEWSPGEALQSLHRRLGDDAYDAFRQRWPDADALAFDHPHRIFFYDTPKQARSHARDFGGRVLQVDPSMVELRFDQLEQPGFWAAVDDVPAAAIRIRKTKPRAP